MYSHLNIKEDKLVFYLPKMSLLFTHEVFTCKVLGLVKDPPCKKRNNMSLIHNFYINDTLK